MDLLQKILIGAFWLDLGNIVHVEDALDLLGFGQRLASRGRLFPLVEIVAHKKYDLLQYILMA